MSGEGCEAWGGQGAIMAGRGRTENDLGCPLLHSRVVVSGGVASGGPGEGGGSQFGQDGQPADDLKLWKN